MPLLLMLSAIVTATLCYSTVVTATLLHSTTSVPIAMFKTPLISTAYSLYKIFTVVHQAK